MLTLLPRLDKIDILVFLNDNFNSPKYTYNFFFIIFHFNTNLKNKIISNIINNFFQIFILN